MPPILHIAIGVIADNNGRILIALRRKDVPQGGLWEFPGGKVVVGESVEQALIRELKEELTITVQQITPLIKIRHRYADSQVLLDVWRVVCFSGQVRANEGQQIQWVLPEQLCTYSFPNANHTIINALRLADEYAILKSAEVDVLVNQLNVLLATGVTLIQARIKDLSESAVLCFFKQAMPLCRAKGALLFVNSGVNGADKVKADGLHLTTLDLLARTSRPGHYAWVAASCHNQFELQHAQAIGVDFVVLSPVLSTTTHLDTQPMGWMQFRQLTDATNLPVFALGGLKKTDKTTAKMAGAQGLSGVSAFLAPSFNHYHPVNP